MSTITRIQMIEVCECVSKGGQIRFEYENKYVDLVLCLTFHSIPRASLTELVFISYTVKPGTRATHCPRR